MCAFLKTAIVIGLWEKEYSEFGSETLTFESNENRVISEERKNIQTFLGDKVTIIAMMKVPPTSCYLKL